VVNSTQQAVGEKFAIESMRHARDRTWEVVERVATRIRPGMLESEAAAECKRILQELGMDRIWHPILIRFGENTLKTGSSAESVGSLMRFRRDRGSDKVSCR
jgi:Xaa-Pro aminopeptidase